MTSANSTKIHAGIHTILENLYILKENAKIEVHLSFLYEREKKKRRKKGEPREVL